MATRGTGTLKWHCWPFSCGPHCIFQNCQTQVDEQKGRSSSQLPPSFPESGLSVVLTLLVAVVVALVAFILRWRRSAAGKKKNRSFIFCTKCLNGSQSWGMGLSRSKEVKRLLRGTWASPSCMHGDAHSGSATTAERTPTGSATLETTPGELPMDRILASTLEWAEPTRSPSTRQVEVARLSRPETCGNLPCASFSLLAILRFHCPPACTTLVSGGRCSHEISTSMHYINVHGHCGCESFLQLWG